MNNFNLNTYAAVSLILAIIVEIYFSARHNLHHYEVNDSLANFIIGVVAILSGTFFKGVALELFSWLKSSSLFQFGSSWVEWILLFLITDLSYYGFHHLGHSSRFFWAAHVTHHSSEKYNLTTAIRSPVTNSWYRFLLGAPLCLLGFSPPMVMAMDSLVLLYTFFLHTESVGKLGWLEYIFNTPSHHRVHHGCNNKYLDKNYGGVLIIWDKLFGSFQQEEERPIYGLTNPQKTNNPIKILFFEWVRLTKDVINSANWRVRLSHLINSPGWKPSSCTQTYLGSSESISTPMAEVNKKPGRG